MFPEVHAVVQNANDLDLSITDDAEEGQMASTPPNSGNVQRGNVLAHFGILLRPSLPFAAGTTLGEDLVGHLAEVVIKVVKGVELPVAAGVEIIDTHLNGLAEGLEASTILSFAAFHKPKSFTQDLARILVPTGVDEPFNQLGLMASLSLA